MLVSTDIEKVIEDIGPLARTLQLSEPDAIILEANKKLATLNLRTEAWLDSGIARTNSVTRKYLMTRLRRRRNGN